MSKVVMRFTPMALGAAGLTAIAVGAAILVAPIRFFAANGVVLADEPSLLSDVRAPGAALLGAGFLILAGAIRRRLAAPAAILGATMFLGYAAGRLVSLAVNGPPSQALIIATVVEAVIGAACVAAALRERADEQRDAGRASAGADAAALVVRD